MVNRTYELVRKNLVAPTWSELPFEGDIACHGQQLPTNTEETMEAVDSEMTELLNDLKDDANDPLFDDIEHFDMDMNVDGTGR